MPASLPFSKAFDFASGATGERFQNPFWKLKEWFFGAHFRRAVFEVKRFGNELVSAAVKKRQDSEKQPQETRLDIAAPLQNNLINSLLDNMDDRHVVADAAMNYLSAGTISNSNLYRFKLNNYTGRDTTAQSLTWTLYLLMRNPSAQKEIVFHLMERFKGSVPPLPLSFDTVQNTSLPYIAAVFNESLRLHPPVPIELKECTSQTTFPDGTWLPKGAIVIWATWAMGHSKNIWGQDADDFRPSRWLIDDDRGINMATLRTMSAYEFPVFNGGPRSCLGKKMAELLAVYVIARLVWKFEFEEAYSTTLKAGEVAPTRQSQNSLTLPMQGGLPCYVRYR